jgi:hypothetical protein
MAGQLHVAGGIDQPIRRRRTARRYDRGDDRTDTAVLRDLLPIVTVWPSVVRQPGSFAIPAGSGIWRGEVAPIVLNGEALTVLSISTFVA